MIKDRIKDRTIILNIYLMCFKIHLSFNIRGKLKASPFLMLNKYVKSKHRAWANVITDLEVATFFDGFKTTFYVDQVVITSSSECGYEDH